MAIDKSDKRTFTVKEGEREITLAIRQPSGSDRVESEKVWNKVWAEAIEKFKSPVRAQIPQLLKERGLWSDADDERIRELEKELGLHGKRLLEGGKNFGSFEEAKEEALLARQKREEFYTLAMRRGSLDNNTAEGQADLAKISYLVSVCTVYNNVSNTPYFKNLNDFYARSAEEASSKAVSEYMEFVNGVDYKFEKSYPENVFLRKYGLVNDELQLINEKGQLVNSKGELVNKFGQRVNEDGALVNINGDPIDEDGNLIIPDSTPFFDKDGNVIQAKNLD